MSETARVAWFHCFSGIAGDMALGSLLDAGAELDSVLDLLGALSLPGWSLEAEPVLRGGIAATRAVVRTADDATSRTHADVVALVAAARLPERVRRRALAAFDALARAEGRLHAKPHLAAHFHEVGGHDAIVDIVGTCAALEVLGVDRVTASPVAVGLGSVHSAHGALPNPAPAVVELLSGAPVVGHDVDVELTTPTGAALLASLARSYGPLPAMTVEASGFGAGARDLDGLPNVTQVVLGQADAGGGLTGPGGPGQPVVLLETNVDDVTGETLAHAVAALLEAGAHDAWITPVVMKKGRPGYVVAALADTSSAQAVAGRLRSETGSLGVRGQTLQRWPASRSMVEVEVEGLPVGIKLSAGRAKVEHDDAARVATQRGLSLHEVRQRAEEAWRRQQAEGDAPAGPG